MSGVLGKKEWGALGGMQPYHTGQIIEVNPDEVKGYVVDPSKAWIQVASGGVFHILEPRQNEIHITDIAHALGMMCRFTGHVRRFYSVAEHCVHASRLVPPQDALWALLHDAPEAYIADLNRPLKHFTAVGQTYSLVEETIMSAICRKFGLMPQQPQSVHDADTAMLYAEKEQLMPPVEWDVKWSSNTEAAKVETRCWAPDVAKAMYLCRFFELTDQI